MTVRELCAGVPGLRVEGDAAARLERASVDSRRAGPGTVFVAVAGAAADGHDFVAAAVAAGCTAVAVREGWDLPADLPPGPRPAAVIRAGRTRGLPAVFARRLLGEPDEGLLVAGVTGTNGKTTVSFLLRHLLGATVGPCGLLGTIRYETGRRSEPAPLTTPDGPRLFELLAEMRAAGCRAAAMELSSHALDQERARDLALDVAVLTNLGRDHLDYHPDLPAYLAAKARIVELVRAAPRRRKPPGAVAVNAGDPAFRALDLAGVRAVRYAATMPAPPDAELRVVEAALGADGTRLVLEHRGARCELRSRLVGRFNAENLTAAVAAGVALGLAPERCAEALAGAPQVPGRLEGFALPGGARAVVDYAHTPDALAAVLQTCRELAAGRVLVVFGCGGDRDRGKRPLMGRAAALAADEAWITSDNPRSEEPAAICREVEAGFAGAGVAARARGRVVLDRRAAIEEALAAARPGDVVLIAGKGHEDYQLVGGRRLELDDRRLVREWIASREAEGPDAGVGL